VAIRRSQRSGEAYGSNHDNDYRISAPEIEIAAINPAE
jgi:hypothetical protein